MLTRYICVGIFALIQTCVIYTEELKTKFLIPGEPILERDFNDGVNPGTPIWRLRKSKWVVEESVLTGVNTDGNGPFIRLNSIEKQGLLPENYIMKFSFMAKENPEVKKGNKYHPENSLGHRFSFNHYTAKIQWRHDKGMVLSMGHDDVHVDADFLIKKGEWYHVIAEMRDDELLVSFKDGPTYFFKDEALRSKPSGWEFFTHISEKAYLDDLQVWSIKEGTKEGWEKVKKELEAKKLIFIHESKPHKK